MPPAKRGQGQCKRGYHHVFKMRRVCASIEGRKGQGKGVGRGGGACKHGVKANGYCKRGPKRAKIGPRYMTPRAVKMAKRKYQKGVNARFAAMGGDM